MKQYNVYAKNGNEWRILGVEIANSEESAIARFRGYSDSELKAKELILWDCYLKEVGNSPQFIETISAETSEIAILTVRKLYRLQSQEIFVKKNKVKVV